MKRESPIILLLTLPLLAGLAGCGSDFLPPSVLDDLRILALVADPLEAGPADPIRMSPVVYLPAGQTVSSQSWKFCPFSAGAVSGYGCAVPLCEVSLQPQADSSVTLVPGELTLECVQNLLESGGTLQEIPGIDDIPQTVAVLLRYRITSSAGVTREAVQSLDLWPRASPATRNHPPVFQEVSMDGTAIAPGESTPPVTRDSEVSIRARIDPASIDAFTDRSGQGRTEDVIISFYTTAGRFAFDAASGADVSVPWRSEKLSEADDAAVLFLVARDLRGGQTVFGPVTIPIQSP